MNKLKYSIILVLMIVTGIKMQADCSPEQANANIRQYYKNIETFVQSANKDLGFMFFNKNILKLIPKGFRMPNEPHMMFNYMQAPFLEPMLFSNSILDFIFPDQMARDSRENSIALKNVRFGTLRKVLYPTNIDQSVDFNYYEMEVDKEYVVNNRSFSLRDTINVRRSDGIVAAQRNKYGGTRFSRQETDIETLYILGESAWNRKQYSEAFTIYRRILEIKETSRVCFQLGLMMYDQWASGNKFDASISRKQAGRYALAYMKHAVDIHDDYKYVKKAQNAIYNIKNRD